MLLLSSSSCAVHVLGSLSSFPRQCFPHRYANEIADVVAAVAVHSERAEEKFSIEIHSMHLNYTKTSPRRP